MPRLPALSAALSVLSCVASNFNYSESFRYPFLASTQGAILTFHHITDINLRRPAKITGT
jgi:hypothetical protein